MIRNKGEHRKRLNSGGFTKKTVYDEYLPSLYRGSSMILLFGYFEKTLVELYEEVYGQKLNRHANINDVISFLNKEKNTNLKLSDNLKLITIIRNKIVHNYGRIAGTKDLKSFLKYKKNNDFVYIHGALIGLKKGFLEDMLRETHAFLEEIYNKIKKM